MASSSIPSDVNLDNIPVFALNVSSRLKLSWFLNPEHSLRSNQGIARDYRGLAEQMGFQYNDIKNFQRSEDPTSKIIEAWSATQNSTIGLLISYLENMDRHDVIEDTVAQFKNDATSYLKKTRQIIESPIQVAEVTSCPQGAFQAESPNALTITDIETGELSYYDAYICYAEEDTRFVQNLAKYLEDRGLVLFFKGRDLLAGTSEPEAHTQLIEERCKFVLIILSPAFLKSPECEWQISFAAGLAVEQQRRKLIPVVTTSCEIPSILKYVSKIDFTKPAQEWLLDKLYQSLRANTSSLFIPSSANSSSLRRQQELCLQSSANPMITFPPTTSHTKPLISWSSPPLEVALVPDFSDIPTTSQNFHVNLANTSTSQVSSVNVSNASTPLQVSPVNLATTRTPPQAKHKWYQNIKEKFSLNSSNTQSSSTSTATSGFHSHSGFVSESSSDSKKRDDFTEDTV